MVPGRADPWVVFAAVKDSVELGGPQGAALGAILAEQHVRVGPADVAAWLPRGAPAGERWRRISAGLGTPSRGR
jgi:hypothetical protein